MNQQPLEYFEAIYACGLKLLHRNYAGPLLQVVRQDDGVEVFVYPDIHGSVSLDSPIEILSGFSGASYLGEFLCFGSYAYDPVITDPEPAITAGVVTLFDQSVNINNLTNESYATQPLICDSGSLFFTDWGLGLSFSGGRYYETNSLQQSFTLHMRMQFLNVVGSRYLFRQTDNALYAKVTDTYLDEAVGTDSTVVFINENYFRDYTTYDIALTPEEGTLMTLEVVVSDNTISSPSLYRIEGIDLFHSVIMYSGVDEHVRRHVTNKVLAEDIPTLAEKLNRFNPQSYYNLVAGAKAMFGAFSFAGVLGQQNTRLMRLKREVGFAYTYIDLFVDNTGYVTLDSPVANPSDGSTASVLGEWVAHPDYNNPDGILATDALIDRLYSQINEANYAYAAGSFAEPKLYDSINEELVSASYNGVVGLEFYVPGDSIPEKGLTLNEPIYAKTVVVVYANKTSNYEMNTLLSAGFGPSIFSKFSGEQVGVPVLGNHGVSLYDQTNYSFTDEGLDIAVHVVALYEDAQKLVVDNTEYDITYDGIPNGIEGTEIEDLAKWKFIGASSAGGSYPHKGRICAVIYYDDDKYDQREFIHNYMNTLFGIQNLPLSELSTPQPQLQSTLLTDYPDAAAAYSLRQINPDYTGPCIRVRRASDNVEIDVRFNSLYEVNQSTIRVFCAGTDGFVTKWYDQSGNGKNATQATTSNQPKIYDAATGVVVDANGNPRISLLSEENMTIGNLNLTEAHGFVVFEKAGLGYFGGLSTAQTANHWGYAFGQIYDGFYNNSRPLIAGNGTIAADTTYVISMKHDGTMVYHLNGSEIYNATGVFTNATNVQLRGIYAFNGYYSEIILYPSDQSANREYIEAEINRHYNIYETGLLGDYPGAAAAYSLRQLNSNYTGPAVRVRRASDNTELNVYFDSTGFIDIAAIAAHCAGTNGFISVWFDQSGGENDATQATTADQPKIYDASTGVVLNDAGKASARFVGSQKFEDITGVLSTNHSAFGVIQGDEARATVYGFGGSLSYTNFEFNLFDFVLFYTFIGNGSSYSSYSAGTIDSSTHLFSNFYNGANYNVYVDSDLGNATTESKTSTGALSIHHRLSGDMKLSELILYPSDQSSNRAAIESNINTEYAIYGQSPTGFLADYPGAAAAYSLRQLISTAKYAVAVRRSSDNAVLPIGFVDGELDTTTLAAFCSGANGFVAVWYDQSGEGNHATQTTTSAQPKIYDASTGVNLDNAKPSVLGGLSKSMNLPLSLSAGYKIYAAQSVVSNAVFIGSDNNADYAIIAQSGSTSTVNAGNATINTTRLNGSAYTLVNRGTTYTDLSGQHLLYADISFSYVGSVMSLAYNNSGVFGMLSTQELIVYPDTSTHTPSEIETNINDAYSIYDQSPTGFLADYPGAAAAYSLRQLISTATYAVAVRRSSDNAVLPIGFVNGELDTTTLAAFCSGANGFVAVWYDQSGEGNHATQTTTSAQPKIYDASTGVITENGLPGLNASGIKFLPFSVSLSGNTFVTGVGSITYSGEKGLIRDGSDQLYIGWNALKYRVELNNVRTESASLASAPGQILVSADVLTTGGGFYVNGALSFSIPYSSFSLSSSNIGSNRDGSFDIIQEVIIYPSDQSANRAGIETNINDFYQIYAP